MRRFVWLALLATACSTGSGYKENRDVADEQWLVADSVTFSFNGYKKKPSSIILPLRYTTDYPYSRLFLHYRLKDSTHHVLAHRLLVQNLFDTKTGEPLGTSGIGSVFSQAITAEKKFAFPYDGIYEVTLVHGMRDEKLSGIVSVGVQVQPMASDKE